MEDRGFSMMMAPKLVITFIIITVISIMVRLAYVIYQSNKPLKNLAQQPLSTLIVLGSGGHTAEMLNLISILKKDRFTPRTYVAASTDNMSLQKARVLEDQTDDEKVTKTTQFLQIYRSREVGQSYLTSVGTTLFAICHALLLMIRIRPQVIICNGPGTCIPLCIIAFLFKVAGIRWSSIFYVESIARVKRLSLSGLLLYKLQIADQFFVQWPQLQLKWKRTVMKSLQKEEWYPISQPVILFNPNGNLKGSIGVMATIIYSDRRREDNEGQKTSGVRRSWVSDRHIWHLIPDL